jgi:hypothetical protein
MQEWNRTDISALTILNHQRHLPPLDRSRDVFRSVVTESAVRQQLGLLTTWDLFRLARSFLLNGWRNDSIAPLFYSAGEIRPVPLNYTPLGRIEHYWERPSAVAIRLEEPLRRGSAIAFELPVAFVEEVATSIQIEGSDVETAPAGAVAGVRTALPKEQARQGTAVYLATRTDGGQGEGDC